MSVWLLRVQSDMGFVTFVTNQAVESASIALSPKQQTLSFLESIQNFSMF